MCGIIFAESFVNHDVSKVILHQYEQQKNRGMQGFGLYDRNKNHLVRSTTERGIKKWLKRYTASSIMFHHRWPTSTDNVKNACHPFSTKDFFKTNYVLVHNGIIANAYELATAHEKMGIQYHSLQEDGRFNDSEALLWDVALYLEGQQEELKARGEIAFICIATPSDGRKSRHLYFGRNSNPINMVLDENKFIFLSSEGEGDPITPNTLYDYNYRNRSLSETPLQIPERVYYGALNGYYTNRKVVGNYWDDDDELAETYDTTLLNDDFWDTKDEGVADLYGYKLLPSSLELSYDKVVEGTYDSSISINGEMINITAKVRNRVQFYLREAFGIYEPAVELADEDYDTVCDQIEQDRKMGFVEDEDLLLERDTIVAALEVLYSSPYWVSKNAVDPGYEALEMVTTSTTKPNLITA